MAIIQVGFTSFSGLSTDTKPTAGMIAGVRFYETDTKQSYIYDGAAWTLDVSGGQPLEKDQFVPWTDTTYKKDDLVVHGAIMYMAKGDINSPTGASPDTDSANWERFLGVPTHPLHVDDFVVWQPSTAYDQEQLVLYKTILYIAKGPVPDTATTTPDADNANWGEYLGGPTTIVTISGFVEWNKDDAYNIDDLVHYQGVLYKCTTDVTHSPPDNPAPDTDASHWEIYLGFNKAKLEEADFTVWAPSTAYPQSTLVLHDTVMYKAKSNVPNTVTDTPDVDTAHWEEYLGSKGKEASIYPFDITASYAVNDMITGGGKIYVAIAAVDPGVWDASEWKEIGGDNAPDTWTDTTYAAGDIVEHNGIAYKAKNAIASPTGNSPDTDATNWEVYYGTITVPTLSVIPTYDELVGILDYAKSMAGKLAAQGLV